MNVNNALKDPYSIINKVYNDMQVIEYVGKTKNYVKIYKVKCLKCGSIKDIEYSRLNNGECTFHNNTSCGVYLEDYRYKREIVYQKEYDKNIGLTMNDYTVIKLDSITKNGYKYVTKCNICGIEHINLISNFKRGYSTNHSECSSHIHDKYIKRFKKIWDCMRQRTTNPNYDEWEYYGGRGINSDYFADFITFYKEMYASYVSHINTYGEKNTTIDRIDVNGNYEPLNCRWATVKEQANNKRNSKLITIENKTKTLKQWCDYYQIGISTVNRRLKAGWNVLDAFTISTDKNKKKYNKYEGDE